MLLGFVGRKTVSVIGRRRNVENVCELLEGNQTDLGWELFRLDRLF